MVMIKQKNINVKNEKYAGTKDVHERWRKGKKWRTIRMEKIKIK